MDLNERKQATIEAFKTFAYLVYEISRDETITDVWSKDAALEEKYRTQHIGAKMADLRNDELIEQSRRAVQKTFATSEPGLIEYVTGSPEGPVKLILRILPSLYNADRVLNVVERIQRNENTEIVEDKWRRALDAAGDGMWEADLESGRMFFSDKWYEMSGYTENDIPDLAAWDSKWHPEDKKAALQRFEAYLRGETRSYSSEARIKCKDGSYKWILSRAVAVAFKDGKPVKTIGTHTDIHERKLREEEALENERKYRVLFDYSEAWICTHDLQGNLLNVNPYACRALKYSKEELVGKNLSSLMPAHLAELFEQEYLPEITTKGAHEGIMRILAKNGCEIIILYKNYLFNDAKGAPYVIGFAQDISERVKMEDELKHSVDMFSNAFNLSGIGMALVSTEGDLMQVNNALCDILGYKRSELVGLNFRNITHPEDLSADHRLLQQMLDRTVETYTHEKRYIAKSGRVIWASLTVSLVWDKKDKPKFFISQVVDITARKQLTKQLHEKNAELEKTQQSLINKIAQLEELSYMIAHNLRGPAGNINMLVGILGARQGRSDVNEEARIMSEVMSTEDAVNMIYDASRSLYGSLDSLLSIAEIRMNRSIPFAHCRFDEIVKIVIQQLKAEILEGGVQIDTQFDIEEIFYPRPYLESILYNLISNSVKYNRPGVQAEVMITTSRYADKVKLSVKDNGLGIDMTLHGDKVFQLKQTFHSGKNAKGIGLYLVKTQVESLGGSISVQSAINEGSEFVVLFNIVKP